MISTIVLTTGLVLMLIGVWGMLTHRNILRIIISLSLIGTGTHILIVAIGYVRGGTAPIIDRALSMAEAPTRASRSDTVRAGGDRDRHRTCGDSRAAGLRDPHRRHEEDSLHRRLTESKW